MYTALLISAFLMGFLGSPHCLGMCGGIVSAFGMSMPDVKQKKWWVLCYHMGRLLSYSLLGFAAGLVGLQLIAPFVSNAGARLILAAAMALAGLLMLGLPILNALERLGLGLWQKLAPIRKRLFPLDSTPKSFGAGILWGFLPCGMVYGALGAAVGIGIGGNQNALHSALFMLCFGIGTMPMLLGAHSILTIIERFSSQKIMRKFSGACMLGFGVFIFAMPLLHSHHSHGHEHHHVNNHANNHTQPQNPSSTPKATTSTDDTDNNAFIDDPMWCHGF